MIRVLAVAVVVLLMTWLAVPSADAPGVQGVTHAEGLWFGPDSTVEIPITWPVPFVDAAYHPSCTFRSVWLSSHTGGGASVQHTRDQTAAGLTVSMHNPHSAWEYGGVSCIAVR